MATTTKQDKVRELQRTLYRAAKADPGRRFHALYDKVYRRDVLERAWGQVRANHGAAGIDHQTLTDVERYGVSRVLDELAADLKEGRWRPLPARRVLIPKPGREELRPLSIPTVRDRVVQAGDTSDYAGHARDAQTLICSTGDSHPRTAGHAGRTGARGKRLFPPRSSVVEALELVAVARVVGPEPLHLGEL